MGKQSWEKPTNTSFFRGKKISGEEKIEDTVDYMEQISSTKYREYIKQNDL